MAAQADPEQRFYTRHPRNGIETFAGLDRNGCGDADHSQCAANTRLYTVFVGRYAREKS